NGEQEGRFEIAAGVVAERLLDGGDRHLIFDGDVHLVIDQGERRQRFVLGDEQPGRVCGVRYRGEQCEEWDGPAHGLPPWGWEPTSRHDCITRDEPTAMGLD